MREVQEQNNSKDVQLQKLVAEGASSSNPTTQAAPAMEADSKVQPDQPSPSSTLSQNLQAFQGMQTSAPSNQAGQANQVSPATNDSVIPRNTPMPPFAAEGTTANGSTDSGSKRSLNSYVERAKATLEKSNNSEKKKVVTRKVLIISGVVLGVVIVALLAWFLVVKLIAKNPTEPGELNPVEEQERNGENKTVFQDVYDEATGESQDEPAEDVFQQAINAAGNNTGEANAVRVSQMRYLLEQGDYDKIIEVGEQTGGGNGNGGGSNGPSGSGGSTTGDIDACEDVNLGIDLRISCHNILGLAYYYKDDIELSDYHMAKMQELMNEKMRMEYPQ